jgi:hypothetical protein
VEELFRLEGYSCKLLRVYIEMTLPLKLIDLQK